MKAVSSEVDSAGGLWETETLYSLSIVRAGDRHWTPFLTRKPRAILEEVAEQLWTLGLVNHPSSVRLELADLPDLKFAPYTTITKARAYKAVLPDRTWCVQRVRKDWWSLSLWAAESIGDLRVDIGSGDAEIEIGESSRARCYAIAREYEGLIDIVPGVQDRMSEALRRVAAKENEAFWLNSDGVHSSWEWLGAQQSTGEVQS